MYNSAFLDDLTKAMGRKSFDEDLKALPEKGGYLCLFDVDKFKNINDTFGHLLGDEVLMKVVKILKSQIPVDKGKVYRFGGDEFAVFIGHIPSPELAQEKAVDLKSVPQCVAFPIMQWIFI